MTSQADLFVPELPVEVRAALDAARAGLRKVAGDIDAALEAFFLDAWAECFELHTHQGFEFAKCDGCGEKTKKLPTEPVTEYGTPDFNEFDRIAEKFDKTVRKVRSLLWDEIYDAAKALRPADSSSAAPDEEGK